MVEGYHYALIELGLKAAGHPLDDEAIGPLTWDIWMRNTIRRHSAILHACQPLGLRPEPSRHSQIQCRLRQRRTLRIALHLRYAIGPVIPATHRFFRNRCVQSRQRPVRRILRQQWLQQGHGNLQSST